VRKCSKEKKIRRGVREVVKSLRKDFKGLVVFAGDVSPIDVISHIPVFCEEKEIPYCYIPTRRQLGMASGTKRPTCVVLIQNHSKYEKLYEKCSKKVKDLPLPL
jgi:H/ACA ribonucleoprotein complex subunit 2